jgi:hypothetical protein
VIFNLPVELFLNEGLTLTSLFEIFWTVSLNEDTGTPEQWAVIDGAEFDGNLKPPVDRRRRRTSLLLWDCWRPDF